MGAFNTLHLQAPCLSCGVEIPLVLQFKYGETRQIEYQLDEQLRWGGNDHGKPGAAHVVALAISEDCPLCQHDGDDYLLHVYNDVLTCIELDDQRYDFQNSEGYFLVLVE